MFLPRLTFRSRFDKLLNSSHGDHTHKRRRCAKKKCKQRAEWSYVKGSIANLDVSPFCAAHACPWRESTGGNCRNPKKSNKIFCKDHLVCQAAPNGQQCPSERSNPLNRDVKFCEIHGCSWAFCNNEILASSGRKLFAYCKDHNCQQAECAEPRLGATGTRQSKYCAAHTCKNDNCMTNVSAMPEVGETKSQHSFCPLHRPCRSTGCDNLVHRVTNAEFRKHCSNHYCEFGNTCDMERAAGVKVCSAHRCWRSGCAKMLQNAAGRFCEDHECKDMTKPCLEEREPNSEWCKAHICQEYRNNRENCRFQGDPANGYYCPDHVRCEKAGCDNKIFIDKGKHRQLCEEHYRGICEYPLCIKVRDRDKNHCEDHGCLAHPKCNISRTPFSSYCTQHKCTNVDCEKPRALASLLPPSALKHLAAGVVPGAGLAAATLSTYDPWCPSHRCRDRGCPVQATVPGGLCATHLCREPGCGTRAAQDNGYCDQHGCHERGCLRAPIDAWHQYCDQHEYGDSDRDDYYGDEDDDDAWSYTNGGGGGALGAGFNGSLAGPGWSGPFGLGGMGSPSRSRRRRIGAARSRSRSRSRSGTNVQKGGGKKGGVRRSRSGNRGANAAWNAWMNQPAF
ncbi:hypothetical protein PG990_002599 [Apiospora arundinis]